MFNNISDTLWQSVLLWVHKENQWPFEIVKATTKSAGTLHIGIFQKNSMRGKCCIQKSLKFKKLTGSVCCSSLLTYFDYFYHRNHEC